MNLDLMGVILETVKDMIGAIDAFNNVRYKDTRHSTKDGDSIVLTLCNRTGTYCPGCTSQPCPNTASIHAIA